MTDGEPRENSGIHTKVSRRQLLRGAAGVGVLAATGGGLYEAAKHFTQPQTPESSLTNNELQGLDKALSAFVNRGSEPEFWNKLQDVISGKEKADKHIEMWHASTRDDKSINATTFNYYADGVKNGEPNMQVLIIEPDGKTYPSTAIDISLQLGKDGNVTEGNRNSLNIPLTLDEIKLKMSNYFIEPTALQPLPWHDATYGTDTRTGQPIKEHERKLDDKNSGFSYRQNVNQRGSMDFTIWYPKTETAPHFIPS